MKHLIPSLPGPQTACLRWAPLLALALCTGCEPLASLPADAPLHLEDHLDAATVVGSEVPAEPLAPVEWRFDVPRPEWKPVVFPRGPRPVETTYTEGALRLTMTESNRSPDGNVLLGLISVELPGYRLGDWGTVLIRARTSDMVGRLDVLFNLHARPERATGLSASASRLGDAAPMIGDGSVHTYAFRTDRLFVPDTIEDLARTASRDFDEPWRQAIIAFYAEEPSSVDLLSVTIVPVEAAYADARVGVRTEIQDRTYRRALYMHAPGRLEYPVRVPVGGRLDLALGVLREDVPVTFRIAAGSKGSQPETLLEETYTEPGKWGPRSVDLSHLAGGDATVTLEADGGTPGTVALWAAPTISGNRVTERPNVVFYVLDGGSADRMSVYGHNRRTTPNLERLAAEGALFENAYSNSTQTWVSTPSFVTSLQSSVLRGHDDSRLVPADDMSMAERLHAVGYQTALLTSNPHAGWYSGLERGFDLLRDALPLDARGEASSVQLHEDFWRWREAYPGEPYMLHVQTTDVHGPWVAAPPFTGLFLTPDLREQTVELEQRRWLLRDSLSPATVYAEAGADVAMHLNAMSALYDEAMAYQDFQIGRLVERLKAMGEWEHTLLIVAADHSHWAGGLRDPALNQYDPMFRTSVTRIPLLFIWPGRIAGGQRFSQPVSMIDVMPTVMDLAGLPEPEVAQGQSLAPLLLGIEGWEPRPVILDEFETDRETGELGGVIEVIDGRWGASLLMKPRPGAWPPSAREDPLLLYDLWTDPYTRHSVHEEHPDLVAHYTAFLEAQFEAHRSLAQLFTRSDPLALTPEQLQALRSLGYIR
jgi:arylsulfatase A-like enzyme